MTRIWWQEFDDKMDTLKDTGQVIMQYYCPGKEQHNEAVVGWRGVNRWQDKRRAKIGYCVDESQSMNDVVEFHSLRTIISFVFEADVDSIMTLNMIDCCIRSSIRQQSERIRHPTETNSHSKEMSVHKINTNTCRWWFLCRILFRILLRIWLWKPIGYQGW